MPRRRRAPRAAPRPRPPPGRSATRSRAARRSCGPGPGAAAASARRSARTRSAFGRISVPRSTSRNGVGTCWLTTRIISSGVTPLATSDGHEGAGAGAHVDVELVDRAVDGQQVERPQRADLVDAAGEPAAARARARSGSARAAAAGGLPAVLRPAFGGFSSRTTSPIRPPSIADRPRGDRSAPAASVFPPHAAEPQGRPRGAGRERPARRSVATPPPRPARAASLGPALARQMRAAGGLLGRLRGRTCPRAGRCSRWKAGYQPHPRLQHQALHHRRRARPLRHRGHARHRGAAAAAGSTRRASGAATSTCAAAATPPSAAAASPAARTAAARPWRRWRKALDRRRHRARDRAGLRRRVALRLPARRPGLRLRHVDLGRAR